MIVTSKISPGWKGINPAILGSFLIAATACSSRPSQPTATKEEFVAVFTRAYESGDVRGLESLVKCDAIPEVRQASLKNLTWFAGRAKIVAAKCEDYDPRFIADRLRKHPNLKFDIEPVYWFTFEVKGDRVEFRYETALGYEKGRLYICGPYENYSNVEEWQQDIHKEFESQGLEPEAPVIEN